MQNINLNWRIERLIIALNRCLKVKGPSEGSWFLTNVKTPAQNGAGNNVNVRISGGSPHHGVIEDKTKINGKWLLAEAKN